MIINTFRHKVKVGSINSVAVQLTFYTFYVIKFVYRQLYSTDTMVENYKEKTSKQVTERQ